MTSSTASSSVIALTANKTQGLRPLLQGDHHASPTTSATLLAGHQAQPAQSKLALCASSVHQHHGSLSRNGLGATFGGQEMKWLLHAALALAIGVAVAVLLAEWMVGCGETYIDSKGVSHKHACLFLGLDK
jgi:hypothetical protein